MGDEEDREAEALLQLLDLQQDLLLHHHVERGRRLVHDHQRRVERQGDGDHRPLPHAAGELVRVGVEAAALDADDVEQGGGPLPRLLA